MLSEKLSSLASSGYEPLSSSELEIWMQNPPRRGEGVAQVHSPLGVPTLVVTNSIHDFACLASHKRANDGWIPIAKLASGCMALIAELHFSADEFDDFEKIIKNYPEASAHILGITFSTAPEILELAQHKTRSILLKVAALDALA